MYARLSVHACSGGTRKKESRRAAPYARVLCTRAAVKTTRPTVEEGKYFTAMVDVVLFIFLGGEGFVAGRRGVIARRMVLRGHLVGVLRLRQVFGMMGVACFFIVFMEKCMAMHSL